MRKQNVTTL